MQTKTYPDSISGVKEFIKDFFDESFKFSPDKIEPDPWVKNVWIAIDTQNKMVQIIYLNQNDAEDIPYISENYKDYLVQK